MTLDQYKTIKTIGIFVCCGILGSLDGALRRAINSTSRWNKKSAAK